MAGLFHMFAGSC